MPDFWVPKDFDFKNVYRSTILSEIILKINQTVITIVTEKNPMYVFLCMHIDALHVQRLVWQIVSTLKLKPLIDEGKVFRQFYLKENEKPWPERLTYPISLPQKQQVLKGIPDVMENIDTILKKLPEHERDRFAEIFREILLILGDYIFQVAVLYSTWEQEKISDLRLYTIQQLRHKIDTLSRSVSNWSEENPYLKQCWDLLRSAITLITQSIWI